jgi:hypothetical protein
LLTPPQTTLHWRKWREVTDANDWTAQGGRLSRDAQRTRELSIYHKLVWKTAEQLALQEHCAVAADQLRHASYLIATTSVPGWPKSARSLASMKDLGNREFSRWLVLCDLLIEPDNLDATMKWEDPSISDSQGLDKAIARLAPDGYTRTISDRIYHTRAWEDLDVNKKRNLRRILTERRGKFNAAPEPQYTEGPF